MKPVLYSHWRSSSSWRVRWALALKGVEFEVVKVDLVAGDQHTPDHRGRNPLGTVPVLRLGEVYLAESMAIIEYLDEVYPQPPLLPGDPLRRAQARQLAEVINAGTQPLQNLSVLRHVSGEAEAQKAWAQHFIRLGLNAYEALVSRQGGGPFSMGEPITLPDLYLVPQCANARRFGVDLAAWPRIAAIEAACLATPEAQATAPDKQPR